MITLVIGGRAQGKTEYIKREFSLSDGDIAPEIGAQRAIVHLEELIKSRGDAVLPLLKERFSQGDCIVCCDEVGMGIVPIDKTERAYRDEVGRILCKIAARADKVIRVFAGLGQVIK